MAIPERLSEQANVTVTGVLFQPLPFTAGDWVAVMLGGVLSRLTVAHAVEERPVLSTALPQMDWLAPSALTATGDGQLASGLDPGAQVKLTVTSELFQPLEFGAGVMAAVMDGAAGGAV